MHDAGTTWKRFDRVQVHGTIMSVALHQQDPNQVFSVPATMGRSMAPRMVVRRGTVPLPAGVKDIYCVAVG